MVMSPWRTVNWVLWNCESRDRLYEEQLHKNNSEIFQVFFVFAPNSRYI